MTVCREVNKIMRPSLQTRRVQHYKQERWLPPTERASVSAHFGLPWVHLWAIAVNVTRMERGFSAGQTQRSMYPSIFNRLLAIIVRYWSEIATFSYHPCIYRPVGGVPVGIPGKCLVVRKLESCGYNQAVKTV